MVKKVGVKNPVSPRAKRVLSPRDKAIAAGKAKRQQYMKKK